MAHDTRPVSFRLTEAQYARYDREAAKAGLSLGALARYRLITSAGDAPPRARQGPPRDRQELALILGHLGRIGGNINQVAKGIHISGSAPPAPVLDRLLRELAAIRSLVVGALGVGQSDP